MCLEGELQGQLNAPRIVRLVGGYNLPEGVVGRDHDGPREEDVIERVQEIGPELEVLVFENCGLLRNREIDVVGLIAAKETESQWKCANVVHELEVSVTVEAARIGQRRAGPARPVVFVLARFVVIDEHRGIISVHYNSDL